MQINSILINLPKRTDRLGHSIAELKKFFGKFEVLVTEGVDMPDSTTLGIREAHKECVKLASHYDFKTALIIEDDICLRDNSSPYFNELMNNLPDDFEVCLFGVYSGNIIETDDKYWNKIQKFAGLHFYLVNEKAYEKILNYNGTQPMDHWIGQNLNCYISKKHFAYQLDGYSDNSKCVTDYNKTNLMKFEKYFLV